MIILKQIKLKNFLSHSDTTLDFSPQQKLLIDGKSGSGKSSIVEGLIWCLYGKGRSDNKSLIKRGAKFAKVIVTLVDDEDKKVYLIERTITDKNKHSFKVLENKKPIKATGITGAQEYLENTILHSSYLLFINSIIYPQDNIESFVKQPASKRKDLVLEIIKAGDYDTYLKKTKEALQENKTNIEVIEAKVESAHRIISEQQEKASHIGEYQKEDLRFKKEAEKLEVEYKKCFKEYQEAFKKSTEMATKECDLSLTTDIIKRNKEKLTLLNQKIINLSVLNVNDLKSKVAELKEKQAQLAELDKIREEASAWNHSIADLMRQAPAERDFDSQLKEINKQMIEVMQEEVEKCPKCSTPYPKMEETRQQRLVALQQRLEECQKDKTDLEETKRAHSERIEALGECPKVDSERREAVIQEINALQPFERKLIEAESAQGVINQATIDITELTKEQRELEVKKKELDLIIANKEEIEKAEKEAKQKVDTQSEAKQTIAENQMENKGRLMVAEEAVKNIESSKKEIEKYDAKVKDTKENIEALEALKGAFGPNGIRAIVIDFVIPQLEEKINNVLQKLSDFRVHLDTQKSGTGKDVVLEGLFIDVINAEGEKYEFSNFSGGERLKIVVAISEGLAEIQKVGFRVLDELFIGLDDESIASFTEVMVELQERFSQMVCISHLQQIKDVFDDKIYVSKTNGTSNIINQ